jgi:hypothetical protein
MRILRSLIKRSENVTAYVHIIKNEAAVILWGSNSMGKCIPLISSRYYSINDAPPIIKNQIPEGFDYNNYPISERSLGFISINGSLIPMADFKSTFPNVVTKSNRSN